MTINDIRCGSGFYNWTEYRERATQAQIWTENGHRIDFDEEDAAEPAEDATENALPPELDVDAALQDILEDTDEQE